MNEIYRSEINFFFTILISSLVLIFVILNSWREIVISRNMKFYDETGEILNSFFLSRNIYFD